MTQMEKAGSSNQPFRQIQHNRLQAVSELVLQTDAHPGLVFIVVDGVIHSNLMIHAGGESNILSQIEICRNPKNSVGPIMVNVLSARSDAVGQG